METVEQPRETTLEQSEQRVCDLIRDVIKPLDRWGKLLTDSERGVQLEIFVSKIGPRYAYSTIKDYEIYDKKQRAVVEALTDFAVHMPERLKASGGLMLFGSPGTGKDHLLSALLKIAIMRHRLRVLWYDAGDLFNQFYFAIKTDDEARLEKLISELKWPHVLAISDPQPPVGDLSDSQVRRLRDLIDARYRLGLSTWITTNVQNKDVAEKLFTEPVMQRLKEGSGIFHCEWESYRDKKPKWSK